jgi:hypothetical protein
MYPLERQANVWSDNFVEFNISWTSSLSVADKLYVVKDSVPCGFYQKTSADREKYRTEWVSMPPGSAVSNVTLDLGRTLHESVILDPQKTEFYDNSFTDRNYPFGLNRAGDGKAFIKSWKVTSKTSTPLESSQLSQGYSLCALCANCDNPGGVDLGIRFKVLAALHVVGEDYGFGPSYVLAAAAQEIIIASGPAFNTGKSVFASTDYLYFVRTDKTCSESNPSAKGSLPWNSLGVNADTTLYQASNKAKLAGLAVKAIMAANKMSFNFQSSSPGLYRLCVTRTVDKARSLFETLDFPGCAVTVIAATQSPKPDVPQTLSSSEFAVSPIFAQTGVAQKFTFSSVFNNTHFGTYEVSPSAHNSFSWRFVSSKTTSFAAGSPSVKDRLSVSELGTGTSTQNQCGSDFYSYQTVPALAQGTSPSSGAARSGVLNGMVPGVYAVCLCNYGYPKSNPSDCTTTAGYRQFVGFVLFDGTYEHTKLAVNPGEKTDLPLKLSSAGPMDRLVITRAKCTQQFTDDHSTFSASALSNPASVRTSAPSETKGKATKSPTLVPTVKSGKVTGYSHNTASPTTANYDKNQKTATKAPATRKPTAAPNPGRRRRRRLLTFSPTGKYTMNPTAADSSRFFWSISIRCAKVGCNSSSPSNAGPLSDLLLLESTVV